MAATETESRNDVKIEDAGPAKKKITITIPAESVDEKIDDSFSTLMSEAQLPGFRKGRAPRALIERRFGSHVRDETRNQLVAEAYSQAIEDHKVRTVGEPEGGELEDLKVEPGKKLTFSVEVEVMPEFEVPDFSGLTISRPIVEVTEEHIDEEIERQLWRHAEPSELEGAVQPGDRLKGRAIVTDSEGEQISDLPDAVVAMPISRDEPRGHVLGLFVEDMFALFEGKAIGDTVTYETIITEHDERPSLRGKDVRVEFTIDGGMHLSKAGVEGVYQSYGLESEEAFRSEVREALEQRAAQEQQAALREQAAEYLLAQIDFEMPQKLSARQAARALDRQRVELLYRGVPADDVEVRMAEIRQESDQQARDRLKMFFILASLAEHFEVQVSEQEINGRIAMMAMQRGERPERLRAELAQSGRLQQIALQIREHKALDAVVGKATVEEISAADWNKRVEERKGGEATKKPAAPKKKTKKKTTTKKSESE